MTPNLKVLLIDDDQDLLTILTRFLSENGIDVDTADSGKKGIKLLESDHNMVICDLKLPDYSGLDILERIKKLQPHTPVVLITGYSDMKTAVEALRKGAADYITKPLYPDELLHLIKEKTAVSEKPNSPFAAPSPAQSTASSPNLEDYVHGESQIMKTLDKNIELVAPTDFSVVITGETGTGKEFVAKRIHELSSRAGKPFISLDCGALPHELAGSELFGHIKGSFTGAIKDKAGHFELAHGGTLFLDEIGNLTYENQVKLLRVLQERKVRRIGGAKEIDVDIRLIVATNEDLQSMIAQNTFREDVYHRINEFSIHIPKISKRGKDILLFADHFRRAANAQLSKNVQGFDDSVEQCFLNYSWPGNLRELRNVVRRAVLICPDDVIKKNHVQENVILNIQETVNAPDDHELENLTLKEVAEMAEKRAIMKALIAHQFNKSKTAEVLGVDRKTLYNKIQAYEIEK